MSDPEMPPEEKPPPTGLPVETPMIWLRFADSDLRGAQLSLDDADPPVLHICSSCQQAVEK